MAAGHPDAVLLRDKSLKTDKAWVETGRRHLEHLAGGTPENSRRPSGVRSSIEAFIDDQMFTSPFQVD